MFKSKIIFTLSLSFLLNASHLPLAYAGRTDGDDNPRHVKARKVVVKKPGEALQTIKEKVRAHNAAFPKPATIWGVLPQNVWEVVGSYLPLDDYFHLFSCNHNFLALGEQLIQNRPLSKPAVLNVPFTLQGKFKGRKFSISHLMRKDLAANWFTDFRDCLEEPEDEMRSSKERKMVRRAAYYAPVHPLMAAYFDLQVRRTFNLYTLTEYRTAKTKFIETVRDHARALDPLALEMITYSRILVGRYRGEEFDLFSKVFPSEDFPRLKRNFSHRLFEQSSNPEYLVNVCRFVAEGEMRHDSNERSNCSIWKSVGIPLLKHPDQGKSFSRLSLSLAEGDVSVVLPHFSNRENAFTFFKTDPLFKAQHVLLKYLANPIDEFCPSMRVLESLVLSTKYKIGEDEITVFHPDFIEESEGYLRRLLSFGERGDEFNTYTNEKFKYIDDGDRQATIDADPSVVRIDAIKKFAYENLLSLYLQKGEQDKAKQIANDMTKDRTGASYFKVGSICESHGRERFALGYYRDAVLKGHHSALYPLWRCVTKILDVDQKMKDYVIAKTEPNKILWNLAHLYYLSKKHEDALFYLNYAGSLDNSGRSDYDAFTICFKYGDADAANRFINSAAGKGYKQALNFLGEAEKNNMTPFEHVKLLFEKNKTVRK
jgi:hypothetical protein